MLFTNPPDELDSAFAAERPRLVRLCAHLTNTPSVAEDLAQETLLEAWRSLARLDNRAVLGPWLSGIARHICLRWRRRSWRESSHLADLETGDRAEQAADKLGDDGDLAVELERHELAALLDRALGLLPPETRLALTQHYLEETPQVVIAARLGLTEGAVAVRLHRGKLAFRRLLEGRLRPEAETFGLVTAAEDHPGWQETRIWCPECGQHRLLGSLDTRRGDFAVRCPACSPESGIEISNTVEHPALFAGIKGYKAAYSRVLAWGYQYYRSVLTEQETGVARCWECGRLRPLLLRWPHDDPGIHPLQRGRRGIYMRCVCHTGRLQYCASHSRALILQLPEARQFWRRHPRIRFLAEREIELDGRPAMVSCFESLGDPARLVVVSLRDTFEVVSMDGAGAPYVAG